MIRVKDKASKIDLVSKNGISPLWSVVRASEKTYWDANGVLRTAAPNEPALDHDPATGLFRGLSKEYQSTNTSRYSEDFMQWSRDYGGRDHYSSISVVGLPRNATLFKPTYIEDPGSSARSLGVFDYTADVVGEGEKWTQSLFVKPIQSKSTDGTPLYAILDKEGLPGNVFFNLADFTVTGNFESAGFINCGNGVYRIWATQISSGSDTASYSFIRFSNRSSLPNFDPYPTGDEEVAFFGYQVEMGELTSYIPTNGAPETREEDNIRILTENHGVFNNFERGTFVVEWETLALNPAVQRNSVLSRSGLNHLLYTYMPNSPQKVVTYNGADPANTHSTNFLDARKFGLAWGNGNKISSVNGGDIVSSEHTNNWGSGDLYIGRQGWSGHVKTLIFYPYKLSEYQLKTQTGAQPILDNGHIFDHENLFSERNDDAWSVGYNSDLRSYPQKTLRMKGDVSFPGLLSEQSSKHITHVRSLDEWQRFEGNARAGEYDKQTGLKELIIDPAQNLISYAQASTVVNGYENKPAAFTLYLQYAGTRYASIEYRQYYSDSRFITFILDFETGELTNILDGSRNGVTAEAIDIGNNVFETKIMRDGIGTSGDNFYIVVAPTLNGQLDTPRSATSHPDKPLKLKVGAFSAEDGLYARSYLEKDRQADFNNITVQAKLNDPVWFRGRARASYDPRMPTIMSSSDFTIYQQNGSLLLESQDSDSFLVADKSVYEPGDLMNFIAYVPELRGVNIALGRDRYNVNWHNSVMNTLKYQSGSITVSQAISELNGVECERNTKSIMQRTFERHGASNAGYYDYSDLSTLFVESDESGIDIIDRTPARVDDYVGAILDKSGFKNHMTALEDNRRGILRSDGRYYWIERQKSTIYKFSASFETNFVVYQSIGSFDNKFIVISDSHAGSGGWTMIYDDGSSTSSIQSLSGLSDPEYYCNGKIMDSTNRNSLYDGITTNPAILRTVHPVLSNRTLNLYQGGYTASSWGMSGNDYGFAWTTGIDPTGIPDIENILRNNTPETI